MRKKKTTEEFKKEVYDLVGDEYSVLGEYFGANTHVLMKHNTCNHEWNIKPSNFLSGRRCPECNHPTYNINKAKKLFKKVGFTLLATKYTGIFDSMPYICDSHPDLGIQYASLTGINQGHTNCPKCRYEKTANSQRTDRSIIIQDFKNAGLILQPNFIYNEMHDVLPCICEKHKNLGIQYISYNNIKYGHQKGCIRCGYERLGNNKRMSDDNIKELVESLDLEFVSVIKDRKTKVKVICPKHREQGVQIKTLDKLKLGQGCKYCNYSHGERRIEKYLQMNNITNIPQKSFNGLLGMGKGNLSYDFYLPNNNLLVEFQGEQHEHYCKWFHKTIEDFYIQVEHDKRKRDYAISSNIKLLTIWYYDYNNIETILDRELQALSINIESA